MADKTPSKDSLVYKRLYDGLSKSCSYGYILGVIKPKHQPDWAKEAIRNLQKNAKMRKGEAR